MHAPPAASDPSSRAERRAHATRRAALRPHQAWANAIAVLVLLAFAWTCTRIALAVLEWRQLETDPFTLLIAFGRGAATDLLFAGAVAASMLAFGALAHRGAGRPRWTRAGRFVRLAVAAAAVGFLAIAELLFWDEFSARFNFIAVDYLVYTTEVVGNIRESYPVAVLLGALVPFGVACAWLLSRLLPLQVQPAWPMRRRALVALLAAVVSVASMRAAIDSNDATASAAGLRHNVLDQEVARNGPASFVAAFRDNELSFRRFYATIDEPRVERLAGAWPRHAAAPRIVRVAAPGASAGARSAGAGARSPGAGASSPSAGAPGPAAAAIPAGRAGRPRHVVIVQVESLSADFLGAFGNREGLTPNLDRLAHEGVVFTEMYATGTRTVRGLEALSAGLPPLPGQSLVRRPGTGNLQTLGAVLRRHGFETTFLYGGYGYFDNMNAYFAANGYRVRDRSDIASERVGFANVWGIADEYLFEDALAELDRAAAGGRRQLLHLMTTSNHRPYTYPEGRVAIPPKTGRRGAVQYTDWAIGRFIEAARTRPWFDDTLFVVVADHCASVAGKTRIPPLRYHIPAIFYSPKHLAAREVSALASQIDLAPTITAWLGIDDGGRFFGHDLFAAHVDERAFLGNYQEIGLLTPGEHGERDLVVLSPRQRVAQYRIAADGSQRAVPLDASKAERTIAEYQLADDLVRSGSYRPQ